MDEEPEEPETPEEPEEPEPQPSLTVTDSVATPISLQSTFPVTLRTTITNTGDASAPAQTIRIYRHTRPTTNPTVGGVREAGSASTGTIAPNASVTGTSTHTASTVTQTTKYYYYVCVETSCVAEPAEVVVRVKPEDPGPPYSLCLYSPERNTPMGGDAAIFQQIGQSYASHCGTLTLGGLETTTGERGFVISNHVTAQSFIPTNYTRVDAFVGHSWDITTLTLKHFLGKLFRAPTI